METIFPEGDGFAGFFLIGFRKDPDSSNKTQRVGTVILKRTYAIGPDTGLPRVLTPATGALPIYTEDTPDNWLVNSDFELSETFKGDGAHTKPGGWTEENDATATRVPGGIAGMALRISGSDVTGRVVQEIDVRTAMKNRQFRFSFWARADSEPAKIESAHLEIDGHILCCIEVNLTTMLKRYSATGIWPAGVEATKIRAVLPIAFDPDHPTHTRNVYYDRAQLEARHRLSDWNDNAWLRIEHDLAPYKPEGDIIVLDYPAAQGEVIVDAVTWLEDNTMSSSQKALFGWEPRVGTSREAESGTFSEDANDYPPEWPVVHAKRDPLPNGPQEEDKFRNTFYNGRRRNAHLPHPQPYLASTKKIGIIRNGNLDYAFQLYGETISARYSFYCGYGADDERHWHTQTVTMNLDTLVIEPEINRCYTVWRGVWNFDEHTDNTYRKLTVSSTGS